MKTLILEETKLALSKVKYNGSLELDEILNWLREDKELYFYLERYDKNYSFEKTNDKYEDAYAELREDDVRFDALDHTWGENYTIVMNNSIILCCEILLVYEELKEKGE
jgi:hypothetical protein